MGRSRSPSYRRQRSPSDRRQRSPSERRRRRSPSYNRRRSRSPPRWESSTTYRSGNSYDSYDNGSYSNKNYGNDIPAPETKPLDQWKLKYTEPEKVPEGLERHRDARRNLKPAWMTKGMGFGEDMFGKPKGIIKPGDVVNDTQGEKPKPKFEDHDPMGDVFRKAMDEKKQEYSTPGASPAQSPSSN